MVTAATSRKKPAKKRTNRVNGFVVENELKDLQFKLTYNLQSTLDIHAALDLFFRNIQDVVPVDGMRFSNSDVAVQEQFGAVKSHTATYGVSSSTLSLGELQFSRNRRFSEKELEILEMLIGVLFYPLRNAMLYRQALENSMRDSLTGIGNRTAMEQCLQREIKLALRHDNPLSLLLLDVDHFKKINDSVGHSNGDKVLKHIVKSVKNSLRETDQIFRFGGEEFLILLHNTGAEPAKLTAERIRVNIALSTLTLDAVNIEPTASIGVAMLRADDSIDTLFDRADKALYQAKNAGRNKVIMEGTREQPILQNTAGLGNNLSY